MLYTKWDKILVISFTWLCCKDKIFAKSDSGRNDTDKNVFKKLYARYHIDEL